MSSSSSRPPTTPRGGAAAAAGCADPNTTFVQADPATFRALVQRLTGAPGGAPAASVEKQQVSGTIFPAVPLPLRRPKLQERRRAAPARLELARPQPFYYHPHHHNHHHHHHGIMQYSPVSTMDYAHALAASSSASSPSPSPPSSCSCGVVISKEEEEREEKAIASKAFYLHSSPRSSVVAGGDSGRPKLLPLFPVHSPRSSSFA
ncbi:VQ motif-containing protein 11-like [Lolium perenne]|uniref:VQ motif-containing protein 11-like n=1 Tax=Lolium perenne TaxID=4522 RepID=UPI0021EA0567|nr:VQ motif-containing protein 11-like [Lolium perenne]